MSKRTENSSAVYQIVNERTLQFYIGSAKDFETRYGRVHDWTKHKNSRLKQDAIAGDKFIYCKIQDCASLVEALCMEQWRLDFYVMNGVWDCLYNRNKFVWKCRPDNTGRKCSEEQKAKISAATKIAMNKQAVKARTIAAQKEAAGKPETRARNSAAQKVAQNRPEVKARNSIAQKEAQNRPEVRAKKSTAQRAALSKPEVRARMSAAQKIAMNKQEVRAKISAGQKIASSKPEVKAKRSAAQKKAQNRLEVLAKNSGEMNVHSKLTNVSVCEIRTKYATGEASMGAMAKEYGVSGKTIYNVIKRRTWKLI